jgi:catechol 2,3-dioxygenase-like lactoylglutathione lyase family enzyme
MFRIEGIDHVALTVRDGRRSVAWYQNVLGLERRYEEAWGDYPAVLGVGTTALAIFPAPVPEPGPPPGRDVLSIRHIAFRVDRAAFEQARGELEAHGLAPQFDDHGVSHSLYVSDPDGHQLEITTYDISRP